MNNIDKVDVLAIGAHPDDVELSCSGTLMHHISLGDKVAILDLTRGELGTRGSADLRDKEAAAAANIMGVHARANVRMKDGFFTWDEEHLKLIITQIRRFQPKVVLCNAISDRHPDHGRGAKLAADACFYAGLRRIETTFNGKPQEAWRPETVYHYIQDHHIKPDFVVDITPYWDKKMESIMAYSSQFYNPNSKEPVSPIATKDFIDFLEGRARQMGRDAGCTFGEGFTVTRPPLVKSLHALS